MTWPEWLAQDCGDIGVSRSNELISIDGRKTLEEVRASTRDRVAQHRANVSPPRNGRSESKPRHPHAEILAEISHVLRRATEAQANDVYWFAKTLVFDPNFVWLKPAATNDESATVAAE